MCSTMFHIVRRSKKKHRKTLMYILYNVVKQHWLKYMIIYRYCHIILNYNIRSLNNIHYCLYSLLWLREYRRRSNLYTAYAAFTWYLIPYQHYSIATWVHVICIISIGQQHTGIHRHTGTQVRKHRDNSESGVSKSMLHVMCYITIYEIA